jgi:hypothetical protein
MPSDVTGEEDEQARAKEAAKIAKKRERQTSGSEAS